jgi:plastocyanin
MRLTLLPALPALVALGAVACGGGNKPATSQAQAATPAAPAAATTSPAAPAAAATAASAPAAVVEVKMTGDGTTKAAFEPATLSIATGTIVRFVNVSGGPHDIAFWADSVPKGGAAALKKGMANQMSDLLGPFLQQPNDKYDVSFAGAPAGVYRGYCLPHRALGMKITITVK